MEKNGDRIENMLVSLICVWLGGWKSGGMKNFLYRVGWHILLTIAGFGFVLIFSFPLSFRE